MLQPAQPTVTGATIGLAVPRDRVTPEIKLLSAGSAAALASIDVYYVAKRRILTDGCERQEIV